MSKELKKAMSNIDRLKGILDQPQYQDQVFKKGEKVEVDAAVFVRLLQVVNNTHNLIKTLQESMSINFQLAGQVLPGVEMVSEDILQMLIESIDQGKTYTNDKEIKEDEGHSNND